MNGVNYIHDLMGDGNLKSCHLLKTGFCTPV